MASSATTFEYSVRDKAGKLQTGTMEAETQGAVVAKLKQMGYAPLKIEQKKTTGTKTEIKVPGFGKKKVKLKDLAIFSRQFATMINSGLSLLRALNILAEQTENPELARVLGVIRNDIETGSSLSVAMAKHPDVFPPLFINMTKAGEVGGFLDSVLLQVAQNYEIEVKLRGKIKSAMTYPVVVFAIAIIAVTGMLLFVVPVFGKMFAEMGAPLPGPTAAMLAFSKAFKIFGPILTVAIVVGTVVYGKNKHNPKLRGVVDPLKMKTPVFGSLSQKIAMSRFTRNLGTMMQSGVPILQSLEIVAATTGNIVLQRAVYDVMDSVRSGESLTGPLANHKVFPAMVVQMMAVGEDTGALDSMLHKISDFYDQEVESTTEALTSLIEPIMIAILGGVVGTMIVILYLPIFALMNVVK